MARHWVWLALILPSLSTLARTPLHLDIDRGTQIAVDYLNIQSSTLDLTGGELKGPRTRSLALYRSDWGSDSPRVTETRQKPGSLADGQSQWSIALGHEYNALDITLTGAQPQTNGDLHTLHLAMGWERAFADGELEVVVAPALSVSSNVLKNPGEVDSDSLQWWGSVLWRQAGSAENWDWVLGVIHDYRFGSARYYPTAGVSWTHGNIALWATYPDLKLDWTLSERWSLAFSLQPDGNSWRVRDEELERQSRFRREAWQADVRLQHKWRSGLNLGLSAGYFWNQQWRFRLEDESLLNSNSDSNTFLGIHLGWQF